MKIKIYCETNSFIDEFQDLKKQRNIELFHFPFENKFKKAKIATPSALMFGEHIHPFQEKYRPFMDFNGSNKFDQILAIVGEPHRFDALHLDSAYKTGCKFFLTKDIRDIFSNKEHLEKLLKLRIFNMNDSEQKASLLQLLK